MTVIGYHRPVARACKRCHKHPCMDDAEWCRRCWVQPNWIEHK